MPTNDCIRHQQKVSRLENVRKRAHRQLIEKRSRVTARGPGEIDRVLGESRQGGKSLLAKNEIGVRVRHFLKFRGQRLATDDRHRLYGALGSEELLRRGPYP